MYHRWTEDDLETLRRLHLQNVPTAEVAEIIGTTTQSAAQYLTVHGISRQRITCVYCRRRLKQAVLGRKKQFCNTDCNRAYHAAYATNARIDGRELTHCEGCGSKLIPPWSTRKKWCSRACGQRAWYESVATNPRKRQRQYGILRLSQKRRRVLDALPAADYDWLLTIREDGAAPRYWMRKLRDALMLDSNTDLVRYSRAIRV